MTDADILIVEDERIIAFDLKEQLQGLGYHVVDVVSSGREALRSIENHRPAIVLMDIYIEGSIDGIDTARQVYGRYRIPVVFLTAFTGDALLRRASETLPFGYLTKPFDLRELHATVQVALARSLAQLALEQSEERLQLALHAANLVVWEWSPADGSLVMHGANVKALQEQLGSSLETWAQLLAFVQAEDRVLLEDQARAALSSGGQFQLCFRLTGADARVCWIELYAKVFIVAEGVPARIIGAMRDVTTLRGAQDKLQQAAVVYETIAEAIMILDEKGCIVSVNPAFALMTGYVENEVLGRDAAQLLQARRHSDGGLSRTKAGVDQQWQGQSHYRRRNGSIVAVWQSIGVLEGRSGSPVRYVVALSDISALRQAEEELRHLACHDPLTGLPNRLHLKDLMTQALTHAQTEKSQCAIVFLDLDGFKTINDSLGHALGDSLLQAVAGRIRANLRRSDIAARLGGDEFVIVLGEIPGPEEASRSVRKMLQALAVPFEIGAQQLSVSASAGVALYSRDGEDAETLLRAADAAMYRAKTQGKARHTFFSREFAVHSDERLAIEQGLRRAIQQQELELHFQPIISMHDGKLAGLEALMRWRHPKEGLISPARFIGVAEETGLIDPIGNWLFLNACTQAAKWIRSGMSIRLTLNVSPRQLTITDVPFQVRNALHLTQFPPQNLELEITESTLQSFEHNASQLEDLRQLGVSISIDDFGTGYSSLSALRQLPIDRLKIDRIFVTDMPRNAHDVAIVEAICAMGHTLGFQVIAEGVETVEQLDLLRRIGCHEVQGFLFSEPLPGSELARLFIARPSWCHFFPNGRD